MFRIFWRLALAVLLIAALAVGFVIQRKGWEQTVTGLPHWSTTCPKDVPAILVIGQSQASNTGPARHLGPSHSYAFADGKCYRLRDPMPGTGGRGGAVWPEFAQALNRPVLIADIAISGSAIEEWVTPEQLAKVHKTLADLRAAGFASPLVIWMQGETNGAKRTSEESYHASLVRLHATAPQARWIITDESICYGQQQKWAALDRARRQLAQANRFVTIGPDLDRLSVGLRQGDQCHFTREGQRLLAQQLAAAARPFLR